MTEMENEILLKTGMTLQSWGEEIKIILKSNQENSFEYILYPNPANDVVNISREFIFNNYVVINTLGAIVKEGADYSIDLSKLESGMYFVRFMDTNNTVLESKKLIKK